MSEILPNMLCIRPSYYALFPPFRLLFLLLQMLVSKYREPTSGSVAINGKESPLQTVPAPWADSRKLAEVLSEAVSSVSVTLEFASVITRVRTLCEES